MTITRASYIKTIKITMIAIMVLFIGGYAISRSLNYVRGPSIEILEPTENSATTSKMIFLRGKADRSNNVILNGNSIEIDEQGNFGQYIIIFPGLNILTIEARDQFERKTQTILHIVGKYML